MYKLLLALVAVLGFVFSVRPALAEVSDAPGPVAAQTATPTGSTEEPETPTEEEDEDEEEEDEPDCD